MLTTVEGRYRGGVVELTEQPVGVVEAEVLVTFLTRTEAATAVVLPDAEDADEAARQEARRRILARMQKGYNLGGGPYYQNREEFYDRLQRPWAGVPSSLQDGQ